MDAFLWTFFPPPQGEKEVLGHSFHIGYFTNGMTDLPKTTGLTAVKAEGKGRVPGVSGGCSDLKELLRRIFITRPPA